MTAFSYDAFTLDVLADGRPALLSVYRNHVRMALPLEHAVAYGVADELRLAVRGAATMGLPGPLTVRVEESVGASGWRNPRRSQPGDEDWKTADGKD
jgi:hypothetical protein